MANNFIPINKNRKIRYQQCGNGHWGILQSGWVFSWNDWKWQAFITNFYNSTKDLVLTKQNAGITQDKTICRYMEREAMKPAFDNMKQNEKKEDINPDQFQPEYCLLLTGFCSCFFDTGSFIFQFLFTEKFAEGPVCFYIGFWLWNYRKINALWFFRLVGQSSVKFPAFYRLVFVIQI